MNQMTNIQKLNMIANKDEISDNDANLSPAESFIKHAQEIHEKLGHNYDYSEVVYVNRKTKVKIRCSKHGIFKQTPSNHTKKDKPTGCPKCAREESATSQRLTVEEFISKAKKIHSDKYDYSKAKYINYNTKVEIICKKNNNEHGTFLQTPSNHLSHEAKCPKCMAEFPIIKEK